MKQKKYKILIVEDDVTLGYLIQRYLEENGYFVARSKTGKSALEEAAKNIYSLYLIDIGLPDISGLSVIENIRNCDLSVPIIVITDKLNQENELASFKKKATLFHRKPINYELLITQINNYLDKNDKNVSLQIKTLTLSCIYHNISNGLETIDLSNSEYNLLHLFFGAEDKIFSRRELINRTMNRNKLNTDSALDTLLSRVRKKLTQIGYTDLISTVHNLGYKINEKYIKDSKL